MPNWAPNRNATTAISAPPPTVVSSAAAAAMDFPTRPPLKYTTEPSSRPKPHRGNPQPKPHHQWPLFIREREREITESRELTGGDEIDADFDPGFNLSLSLTCAWVWVARLY